MAGIVVFIRSMHALGDQLVGYPLLYQLHQQYPNHRVTVVAHDPVGNYYTQLPWVHQFVHATMAAQKYRSIAKDTEIIIALHHSSELYSLLGAIKRVPVRLGFKNKRATDFLWTHRLPKDINQYIGLANLQLLGQLHPFDTGQAARHSMAWLASQKNTPVEHTDVVFMVGGGAGAFKRWGIANYTALAQRLQHHLGPNTTFTCILGPAETSELAQLQQINTPHLRLMVSRPLAEIADLCLNAKLIVANDCGPSHIAQNTGTPYVGLFNEPNPEWFWQRPNTRAVTPPQGTIDIQSVSIECVEAACCNALKNISNESKTAMVA